MRKLGINISSYDGITYKEYVRLVSEAGFNCMFTGLNAQVENGSISELAAEYGLEYETIHAPFKTINDIWSDNTAGEDCLSMLCHSVDVCHTYGVGKLVVHLSSKDDAPFPNDIGTDRFIRLVAYAAEKEVIIAFENQRKLANIAIMLERCRDNKYVGFCWDVGHESCFTPTRDYMGLFGEMLVCTHIHDNNRTHNDDLHMLPFDGKIDFTSVAEKLKKFNYEGPLTLEVLPKKTNYCERMSAREYIFTAYERAKKLAAMVDG